MPKVTNVEVLPEYKLRVRFDNGFDGVFDMSGELWGELGRPLKDPAYFGRVQIEHGAVSWPNGFDICPDALYYEMTGEPVPFRLPEETPAV